MNMCIAHTIRAQLLTTIIITESKICAINNPVAFTSFLLPLPLLRLLQPLLHTHTLHSKWSKISLSYIFRVDIKLIFSLYLSACFTGGDVLWLMVVIKWSCCLPQTSPVNANTAYHSNISNEITVVNFSLSRKNKDFTVCTPIIIYPYLCIGRRRHCSVLRLLLAWRTMMTGLARFHVMMIIIRRTEIV